MEKKTLEIDPSEFGGGIAIWSAMPPVFDTSTVPSESGIHVHARRLPGKAKAIDESFDRVIIKTAQTGSVEIDGDLASAFNLASILVETPQPLKCPMCSALVTDLGWNALKPQKTHDCGACGHAFISATAIIANPIAAIRHTLNGGRERKTPEVSKLNWRRSCKDWPDGIQIWGSNAAILWTAERPEASGIHVHAYNHGSRRKADETFGAVQIDGEELNPVQIRFLMAQRYSPLLMQAVCTLVCPKCGDALFDVESPATPKMLHNCACGMLIESSFPAISNPSFAQLSLIKQKWETLHV